MRKFFITVLAVLVLAIMAGCGGQTAKPAAPANPASPKAPANAAVILATTTSTQDSGLLDALLPVFEKKTGFKVKTIAVGTGQALAMGEKGEADVLLVHAPAAEKKFVGDNIFMNVENRLSGNEKLHLDTLVSVFLTIKV